jgi:hypothetical protein
MLLDLRDSGNLNIPLDDLAVHLPSDVASLTDAATIETEDSNLAKLLAMPHKTYEVAHVPDDVLNLTASNYMDTAYRDEFLTNLDSQLEDPTFLEDGNKPLRPPPSRVLPSDKDLAVQNADSVISWLRRHHPETFIQDKDHPEKEKPEPNKRVAGKRSSLAQSAVVAKVEPEDAEEDIALIPEPPEKPTRGKKSKDDESYRPKGGSSRGSKRKRAEEGDGKVSARGKRAKGAA